MNQFLPILNKRIPDPHHGWLLSTAFTLAALGVNQYQLNKVKSQLKPGIHWIEQVGSDRVKRHFYTAVGVASLCNLINSDRSLLLLQVVQGLDAGSFAIIPRPQTTAIHESQWQPRQPEPVYEPELLNIRPYTQAELEIQPPSVSSNIVNDPRFIEMLQLKRDQIELQRSELENERLRMIQDAYQQRQQPVNLPAVQQQPQPEIQRYAAPEPVRYQEPAPIRAATIPQQPQQPINIKVNMNSSGGYYWDGFGMVEYMFAMFLICMIGLAAIGVIGMASSSRSSALPEVSRHA